MLKYLQMGWPCLWNGFLVFWVQMKPDRPRVGGCPYTQLLRLFSPQCEKGSIGHRSSAMSYEGFHNWGWGKGLRILIITALLADTVQWLLECVDCCKRQLLFKEWNIEQSATLTNLNEKKRSEKRSREACSGEKLRAGQPERREICGERGNNWRKTAGQILPQLAEQKTGREWGEEGNSQGLSSEDWELEGSWGQALRTISPAQDCEGHQRYKPWILAPRI